ncbi:hypothetical protein HDU89_007769 [Geranomyces variabilis]|nr:hypothetical protein HDU89_007769 [Geranomyces variabilis]
MQNNQLERVSEDGFKKAVHGFMKGETNADPTFEMGITLPFELEQELTAGNRLFISFALRELFVLPWRDALAKNDMRTKAEAAEWPIICQSAADGSFLPSKHAPATALNNGMKELARLAALDDRYISLKSNRKGFAQAARSGVGMLETQRLLNHRAGSNATARYIGADISTTNTAAVWLGNQATATKSLNSPFARRASQAVISATAEDYKEFDNDEKL